MKDGFIRVAAGSFKVSIANVKKNAQEIIRLSKEANANHTQVLVLNELCLTGYTIEDLFFHLEYIEAVFLIHSILFSERKDLQLYNQLNITHLIQEPVYDLRWLLLING